MLLLHVVLPAILKTLNIYYNNNNDKNIQSFSLLTEAVSASNLFFLMALPLSVQ